MNSHKNARLTCHRSSRPRRTPGTLRERVKKLRQPRWPYHAIAHKVGVSRSTVARILKAASLHRCSASAQAVPPTRQEGVVYEQNGYKELEC